MLADGRLCLRIQACILQQSGSLVPRAPKAAPVGFWGCSGTEIFEITIGLESIVDSKCKIASEAGNSDAES